jgi:hypothetical protein
MGMTIGKRVVLGEGFAPGHVRARSGIPTA